MKKLISKARSTFQDSLVFPSTNPPYPSPNPDHSTTPKPNPGLLNALDVYRYRYNHGTNLGSIFVLEKWLHPSMYPGTTSNGSELSAVSTSIASIGLSATRQKWENHWSTALSDIDLLWLACEAGCTSIRLPIGYFTFGPRFCHGTDFEPVAAVYENAWEAVLRLVEKCGAFGIGVLVDLHALPGGANGDDHSGCGSGIAGFWTSKSFRKRGVECIEFLTRELRGCGNLVGIQIVNEASHGAEEVWGWYECVLDRVKRIDGSIPIYISDVWEVEKAAKWIEKMHKKKAMSNGWNPLVIDTHKYYTFSDAHRSMTPAEIISRVATEVKELKGLAVVVGEYSCVLDEQTWNRVKDSEKESCIHEFAIAQGQAWQRYTAGSYFWTLKMEWMDGGEWGFVEQTKKSNVVAPTYMFWSYEVVRDKAHGALLQREELGRKAREDHENYWNGVAKGKPMEHERYSKGWRLGFDDASAVFTMRSNGGFGQSVGQGADKVGCADTWVRKRAKDVGGLSGEFVWEWEQGVQAGILAFNEVVGI